jgi:hypothetical protein
MRIAKLILLTWVLMLIIPACSSAEQATHERRNLLMPEKSDLKRNDKYRPTKANKTYSSSKKKKKKKK